MKSGALLIGVDSGNEVDMPALCVMKHENGRYEVLRLFTGDEAKMVYDLLTGGKETEDDQCYGCDYLGESCVGEGCGKLDETKKEADDE